MKSKMLAGVFEGKGKLTLKEVAVPIIEGGDDVIIRVDACGICGTDIHILKTPPDFIIGLNIILGHEIAGMIEKVGYSVRDLQVGDRVVVNQDSYCDSCKYCKMDLRNLCNKKASLGITKNGGFAEYCKTSEKLCHKISPKISPEIASLAIPLAEVINATQKVMIQPWDSVVVLGGGPIGNLFMQVFKISGASKIILSQRSEHRRKIAKECGADIIVDPDIENIEEVIKRETIDGADVVIDTVGSLMEIGIRITKKGGKLLLFGINTKFTAQILQSDITLREIQILGSHAANRYFPQAVSLVESGVLKLEKLITHKVLLKDIHKVIKAITEKKALKVIVKP